MFTYFSQGSAATALGEVIVSIQTSFKDPFEFNSEKLYENWSSIAVVNISGILYETWDSLRPFTLFAGRRLWLALKVENHDNCVYDYVEVRDGHEDSSRRLGKYCGHRMPNDVKSTTNKMYVKFVSDASVQKGGFAAVFVKGQFAPLIRTSCADCSGAATVCRASLLVLT